MSYLKIFICVTIQNCVNFGDPIILISKWQSSVYESWTDESFQILEIKVFVEKKSHFFLSSILKNEIYRLLQK